MADGKKRTLREWLEEKKMTPAQLMRAGAGVSSRAFAGWAKTGQVPLEVTANRGRFIDVASALGVPLEELDCGPVHRPMSEAGYQIVLYTHQTVNHDSEAYLGAWGPPKTWPDHTVSPSPVETRTQ